MNALNHPRIVIDPAVCGGRPTVEGTQMRVSDTLGALASGVTEVNLLADFPYITIEDVRACLDFAASVARRWDWIDEYGSCPRARPAWRCWPPMRRGWRGTPSVSPISRERSHRPTESAYPVHERTGHGGSPEQRRQ